MIKKMTGSLLLSWALLASAAPLDKQLLEATADYVDHPSPKKMAVVEKLLQQGAKPHFAVPMNDDQPEIATALGLAILVDDASLVSRFLQTKPNLELPISPSRNYTPLLLNVISRGDNAKERAANLAILKDLLDHGAKPDARFPDNQQTALMVVGGMTQIDPVNIEAVRLLLKAGANPSLRDGANDWPLTGLGASNLEMIQLMLEAKAKDVKKPNNLGYTPMQYVCTRHVSTKKGAPDKEAGQRIALLRQQGLDLNELPKEAMVSAPFKEALDQRNPDCVEAFLDQGLSLDTPAVKTGLSPAISFREYFKTPEGKQTLKDAKLPERILKRLR